MNCALEVNHPQKRAPVDVEVVVNAACDYHPHLLNAMAVAVSYVLSVIITGGFREFAQQGTEFWSGKIQPCVGVKCILKGEPTYGGSRKISGTVVDLEEIAVTGLGHGEVMDTLMDADCDDFVVVAHLDQIDQAPGD